MSEPGYEPGYGYTQKSRNSSKKSTKTKTEQNINRCNSIHLNNPSTVLLCTNCLLYSASDQYDEELALRFFFKVRLRHILQASNFEHPPYPASLLQENSHLHRSASTQSFHPLKDSFKSLAHLKLKLECVESMVRRKKGSPRPPLLYFQARLYNKSTSKVRFQAIEISLLQFISLLVLVLSLSLLQENAHLRRSAHLKLECVGVHGYKKGRYGCKKESPRPPLLYFQARLHNKSITKVGFQAIEISP